MKHVMLGKTGIEVSELSFGTLTFGRIQNNSTPEEAAPAIQKGLEMGITLFDTSQSYATQNHLRVGLGSARNRVIISFRAGFSRETHAYPRWGGRPMGAADAPHNRVINVTVAHLLFRAVTDGQCVSA